MDDQFEMRRGKPATFSPREFLLKYIKYLPWLIISTLILITLAWVKLRYSTDIYEVRAKLLVKNESSFGGQDKLSALFMADQSQNLNDETEILKSTGLSKRIVQALGLQISYFNLGKLKSTQIHPLASPFYLDLIQIKDSSHAFTINVKFVNDYVLNLGDSTKPIYFGEIIENNYAKFRLIKNTLSYHVFGSNAFSVSWQPLEDVAGGIAGSFKIAPSIDFSNVLLITHQTENPRLGKDILNQLMQEYNISSVEDKRKIAVYTLQFIDERLDTLRQELGGVEQNLQNYRERNRALDLSQQAMLSFNELSDVNKILTQQDVKLKVLLYLQSYISDRKNIDKTVPNQLGIDEPTLTVLIQQYNTAQLKRETLLKTTTASNQLVVDLDTDIEKLRQQIQENLSNIHQSYLINRNDLMQKSHSTETEISAVPGKAKRLLEITRQQKTLEELYSFLLQKRLETSIASASTISNSKVVEPAYYSYVPVMPNRRGLYMLATLLGLLIPISFVVIKEYLNDKISGRLDVERLTSAPILGEIGHSKEKETLVVTKNNRKFIAEQFRIVRTNLQYIINKIERPIILVTSSFSGEGKSFISTNMGAVLALAGKKTVILEFDLRKPKIIAGLDLARNAGITNFIIGSERIEDLIISVGQVENLYVIPCGPVPPNPAELLLDEKLDEMFKYLRSHFDMVIIDSAPVGLVSDALLLSRFADATVYITRQHYTYKNQIGLINDLHANKKLPKISLILNDVKSGSGGYGNGYGSGYGYGYGYGSGYFEDDKKKKKGIRRRVKKWFS